MLNFILDNLDFISCVELQNLWTEEPSAFNSLSIANFPNWNFPISQFPEYDSNSYSDRVKPKLILDEF